MVPKAGNTIRADAGGGVFWNGVVESVAFGKVRVRTTTGHIVEVPLRGDHTVNGVKPGSPDTPVGLLRVLDRCDNLSEWESEFVGDLCEISPAHFTPKQVEMIERIYKRRVQDV